MDFVNWITIFREKPCYQDMHDIEPYYLWRDYYTAEVDPQSPFFGRTYSEFEFSNRIYNYYIHPQWDEIGSPTLFIKIIFVDYQDGYAVIEVFGEWNDCLHNDIMYLKRDVIDVLLLNGVNKFILIAENVFNFHASDDSYYEEWFDDVEDGWIALLNLRDHVRSDLKAAGLDTFLMFGGKFGSFGWTKFTPEDLFNEIDGMVTRRLQS